MKLSPIFEWLRRNPKDSKPAVSPKEPSGVKQNQHGSSGKNHEQALQAARAAWGKAAGGAPTVKPEQKQFMTDTVGPEIPAPSKVAISHKWGAKRRMLLWSALLLFLASTASLGLFASWVRGLDISKLEHPLPEPSFVMDAGGQPVSRLSSSRIIPVPLTDIPADLKNAVIAVEDRRFYEHAGFDLWSIGRALVRDLQSGSLKEGGSTITQQLAKNLFLDSDKTLGRKVKELGYAIKINFTYSKDQILELYLNSIYYGEGRWGVEGAAQQYFGKPVKELTLAESAMLAGLPKAPTLYSPVKNPDKALERRNLVLSLMLEQGTIDEAAYAKAVNQPIKLKPDNGESLKGQHPSFVDYVMDEAEKLYGFTEQQILTLGLRIHTTMDVKVQQAAEDVYRTDALFPADPGDRPVQSGVVVLDHRTGGIRAIVGGRGDQEYRSFNRATKLKRQPGSSFKPLAVYGPALERGYNPDSWLYDGELDIGGYRPKNWDGQTRGQVTLREAVLRSWNIPPVWLLNEIGIDAGMDYVHRAGITLPGEDRNLSLALGGLSEGVSPLQMAQAYGAIANEGVMERAHAITRITTKEGQPLVEAQPQPTTLTAPIYAYTLTQLLQEAVAVGTGKAAALDGRPTAGKTGTTQLPDTPEFASIGSNGAKDAWFVGFTPELTAAIWLGYDQTDRKHYLTTSGGAVPAKLFREIMTRALKDIPVTPFPVPQKVLAAQQSAWQNMYRDEEDRRPKRDEKKDKEEKKDKKKDKKDNDD